MTRIWSTVLALGCIFGSAGCNSNTGLPGVVRLEAQCVDGQLVAETILEVSFSLDMHPCAARLVYGDLGEGWTIGVDPDDPGTIPDLGGLVVLKASPVRSGQQDVGLAEFGDPVRAPRRVTLKVKLRYEGPESGAKSLPGFFEIRKICYSDDPTVFEPTDVGDYLPKEPFRAEVSSCDELPPVPPIPGPGPLDTLLFVRTPEAFSDDSAIYAGELLDPSPNPRLHDWPGVIEEARVSPNARWLAFTSVREELGGVASEIYLLDRTDKTAAPIRLTDALGARAHFYEIDWSRDNQRIAARRWSLSSGKSTIAVISIPSLPFDEGAGGAGVDLTDGDDDSHPAWGPGDREIAFVRLVPVPGTTGYRRLHRVDVGSEVVRRDERWVDQTDGVAWSPDGKKIAFSSNNAVWVLREGATEQAYNVTAGDLQDLPFASPEFSPDAGTIVMSAYVGSQNATLLFAVAADTGTGIGILEERPDPPMLLPVSDTGGLGGQFFFPSMFRESSK